MTVETTAPGMIHPEGSALNSPVIVQELFQGLIRRVKQEVDSDFIVKLKELARLLRDRKHGIKMRAIRESLAHVLRPLRLAGTQATRAMTVAARTGIPIQITARLALHRVKPEFAMPAMTDIIKGGILLVTQSSRPEITPDT